MTAISLTWARAFVRPGAIVFATLFALDSMARALLSTVIPLEAYQTCLGIGTRLAAADPDNAGWMRDLAISYGKLAAAYHRLGKTRQALAELRKADELIPLDWANTCDLASCHMRLGYWLRSDDEFEQCRQRLQKVIEDLRKYD